MQILKYSRMLSLYRRMYQLHPTAAKAFAFPFIFFFRQTSAVLLPSNLEVGRSTFRAFKWRAMPFFVQLLALSP